MSSSLRRFEVLLPQRFNDGQAVPEALFGETLLELRTAFHAASWETQTIHGVWEQGGTVYSDDLIRIYVDVADTPENRQFFREFKEQLKVRFQQLEIRITSYVIEAS